MLFGSGVTGRTGSDREQRPEDYDRTDDPENFCSFSHGLIVLSHLAARYAFFQSERFSFSDCGWLGWLNWIRWLGWLRWLNWLNWLRWLGWIRWLNWMDRG